MRRACFHKMALDAIAPLVNPPNGPPGSNGNGNGSNGNGNGSNGNGSNGFPSGRPPCGCKTHPGQTSFVVVTGGPGAGKTAIHELARRRFCDHVRVLPEAASMLCGGGFPRIGAVDARRAIQLAIFHVQQSIERAVAADGVTGVALCDRGTLDGIAYWPDDEASYLQAVGTTKEAMYAHYAAVIHLRTPSVRHYNHDNPFRIEPFERAAALDEKIAAIWAGHPRRTVIDANDDFLEKARRALEAIETHVPACCLAASRAARAVISTDAAIDATMTTRDP